MTFSRGPNKSTSMSGSIPRAASTRRDSGRWLETHQRNGPSAGCALRPSGLSVPLLDTAGRLRHPIASRAYFTPWRCSFFITCPKFLAFSTIFGRRNFAFSSRGPGRQSKFNGAKLLAIAQPGDRFPLGSVVLTATLAPLRKPDGAFCLNSSIRKKFGINTKSHFAIIGRKGFSVLAKSG